LLIVTAADTIIFVVNTAAAFAPVGHTINPKSFLPDTFIPQATPAAKNPFAAVMLLLNIPVPLLKIIFHIIQDSP
jgi:hypothetical protein